MGDNAYWRRHHSIEAARLQRELDTVTAERDAARGEVERLAPVVAWIKANHTYERDSDVVDVDHGPVVTWEVCLWCEDHGLPSDWPCMFITAIGGP